MTRLCGHLLSPVQDIVAIRDENVSEAGVPESGQSLTIWAGRALTCARYTQDPNKERCRGLLDASGSAGVLSRGVGLRGFESHPPHQRYNLETTKKLVILLRGLIVGLILFP